MKFTDEPGLGTLLQHFAEEEKPHHAVAPPIFHTSLFVYESYAEFSKAQIETPGGPPFHYSRVGNPTLDIVERKVAMLERCDACKVFSSGMAAISVAVLSAVNTGAHIVAVDTCYGVSRFMFDDYLTKFGISTTYVDGLTPESVLDAIRPETTLVYLESPSSLVFRLQDIEAITKGCREKGVTTLFDNSYASPLYQTPAAMGVDIVVHSATKYLGGHSDITAGVVASSKERIDKLIRNEVMIFGSALAPFPAWLMLRGMRTLPLRLKHHEQSANAVAAWLERHAKIERVIHLGLDSYGQKELFCKQMRGSGGLFSFIPKNQNRDAVLGLVDRLKLFQIGVSWGGFESLAVPVLLKPLGWDEETYVVRLYCGLEEPKDLIKDLEQALAEM
jgi:cystathionine beta-lyase/cystathionine gamma-synthase